MESYISTVIKNLSGWTRKATVLAVDTFSGIGSTALDNANVLLSKTRVTLSDSATVTWDAIRSLTNQRSR